MKHYISIIFLSMIFFTTSAIANKTPSHVFQAAKALEMDVLSLIQQESPGKQPKTPYVQSNKLPVHVYAKATEINGKIIRLQKKMNLPTSELKTIPIRKITPSDVFNIVSFLREEMGILLKSKNINLNTAEFEGAKTPSNVYEQLMRVSYALDVLVGNINPNLVFRNGLMIQSDLALIANKLNIQIPSATPKIIPGSKPFDVNIEAFKNLYRIAAVERKLNLKPVRVSDFPIGKITPGDVYDTTNNILAELTRIKAKLNISEQTKSFSTPKGKKPTEVLQLMQTIGNQLDAIKMM